MRQLILLFKDNGFDAEIHNSVLAYLDTIYGKTTIEKNDLLDIILIHCINLSYRYPEIDLYVNKISDKLLKSYLNEDLPQQMGKNKLTNNDFLFQYFMS